MNNEDADIDSMITSFNTAVTETASETLGKHSKNLKKQNPGSLQHSWFVPQKERTGKKKKEKKKRELTEMLLR